MKPNFIVSVSFGSSAVFRWRRQSCPDDEGHLCCLGHGDILVMDGQCRDEYGPWPGTGTDKRYVPMDQTTCCILFLLGFISSCYGELWEWLFFRAFGVLFGALCIWGVLVLLVSLLCTRLGLHRCASCWTRPFGRWSVGGITFVTSGEKV